MLPQHLSDLLLGLAMHWTAGTGKLETSTACCHTHFAEVCDERVVASAASLNCHCAMGYPLAGGALLLGAGGAPINGSYGGFEQRLIVLQAEHGALHAAASTIWTIVACVRDRERYVFVHEAHVQPLQYGWHVDHPITMPCPLLGRSMQQRRGCLCGAASAYKLPSATQRGDKGPGDAA